MPVTCKFRYELMKVLKIDRKSKKLFWSITASNDATVFVVVIVSSLLTQLRCQFRPMSHFQMVKYYIYLIQHVVYADSETVDDRSVYQLVHYYSVGCIMK